MAERTGLEPVAFAVTGRRYNQLNYRSTFYQRAIEHEDLDPLATGVKASH